MSQIAELSQPWVSRSETEPEQPDVFLRGDVREIAERLEAVREALGRRRARPSGSQRDLRRLFEAFAREVAAELATAEEETTIVATWPQAQEPARGEHAAVWFPAHYHAALSPTADEDLVLYTYWGQASGEPAVARPKSTSTISFVPVFVSPSETTVVAGEPERTTGPNPALVAFRELKDWLGISYEETAEVSGIGRTTPYSWERGRVPRASTVRALYELRELVAALLRVLGEGRLREWLNQAEEDGRTPLGLLLSGTLEEFRSRAQSILFPIRRERPSAGVRSFEPDPDVDKPVITGRGVRRARRERRKRDR
jgi:transcriptional regulator with XRE-family HTH domain